jgi:tetratricopeptide (TPR) repeat protein
LLFAKWLGLPNDDYLDNLIASGWISQKSNKIDLDPPIQEFIAAERSQNIEKYKKLTDALIESAINIDDYETTLLLADIGKHICGFLNKNKSPDSLETANIHIATGDALFNTKQYREALEFFLISEKILSSLNEHNEKIYDKIASTSVLYSSPTQSKYILTILEKEYEMQKAMVPLNPARIIYIAPMLASHYDNNDQHTKALEIIKHALMIVKVHEVKESYDLAELYHKASVLFCHIHSYYIALDYIYKFRDLVKDKERSNEVTLCKDDFYDIIGFIYSGLGLHERALENKKECLKLRKEFFQDLNHPIIARIYNRIGISYADLYNFKNDLDDFENAVYYLKEALKIREHFAAGSNTIDVATSKNNIGCCYYAYRDFKTAYEFLKEAYEIRKSIKTTPINELISSYFNIGTVLFYMEKEDEAWSYIKEAYNTVKEKNFEHVFLKFLPSSNFHNQVISAEEDLRIWITDKLSPEPLFDKEKGGYWTTKRANEYNV